jgi:hypothetical protein
LGRFLSESSLQHLLNTTLRKSIMESPIDELPAVPLLEYSTAAVVGRKPQKDATLTRFAPGVFELLCKHPDLILEPRSCFHFTDCIPLPWFSLTERFRANGNQLRTMTNCRPAKHNHSEIDKCQLNRFLRTDEERHR